MEERFPTQGYSDEHGPGLVSEAHHRGEDSNSPGTDGEEGEDDLVVPDN